MAADHRHVLNSVNSEQSDFYLNCPFLQGFVILLAISLYTQPCLQVMVFMGEATQFEQVFFLFWGGFRLIVDICQR